MTQPEKLVTGETVTVRGIDFVKVTANRLRCTQCKRWVPVGTANQHVFECETQTFATEGRS
jgi:hypothetical protein